MNKRAYLQRIGITPDRLNDTGIDTIRALQRTHLKTVPFETLSIAGNPGAEGHEPWVSLDIDEIDNKIVSDGRGGFCYELNVLFRWLLSACGFYVERVAGRIYSENNAVMVRGWIIESRADETLVVTDRSGSVTVDLAGKYNEGSLVPGRAVEVVGDVEAEPSSRLVAEEVTTFECSRADADGGPLPEIDSFVAMATLRDGIHRTLREILRKHGGIEITTPNLVGVTMEGDSEPTGTELFEVDYFNDRAYLAQSPQIFKQMCAVNGLERVFEVTSFYRAESSAQHLAESISVDYEAAFSTAADVMDVCETLVSNCITNSIVDHAQELETLGSEVSTDVVDRPFPRIRYEEAIEVINETAGLEVAFGDDLPVEGEKMLGASIDNCYFVTDWPAEVKSFCIMSNDDGTSKSFDLMHPDIELASGGQREHRYSHIRAGLERQGINDPNMEPYVEFFRGSIPPHAGFGLGVDRLLGVIAGVEDVSETVPFPRTSDRLVP